MEKYREGKRIWRLRLLSVALLAGLAGYPSLTRAEGALPDAAIDEAALELNKDASPGDAQTSMRQDAKSSDDIVRELVDAYMQDHHYVEGYNPAIGKNFAYAIRTVSVNSASPEFGKSRVLAYNQAYNEALKSFIKAQSTRIVSETVTSFFSDASTDAGEFKDELASGRSTMGAMLDKLVALGDAWTSDKLRNYGIDPDQYNAAPPDQKKVLLSQSIVQRTTERAGKSLGGVVPVQTFIGEDGQGNQSVGVLIMYSPKLEAVAEALRRGKKPAIQKQGPPLQDILPLHDPAKLYDMLGVRVLFDEYGPVVVSYGQWSSSYQGTDQRLRSRYANTAFSQAETQANAQISEFLNTNFSSEDQTQVGEAMEQALIKEGGSGQIVEPDVAANIVDIRKEFATRKTSALLRGASTIKKWTYRTPDGHDIVGVIKIYSFANMEAASQTFRKPEAGRPVSVGSGHASGRMSQEQMDIDSF